MTDNITLIGFVATPPRHTVTGEGLPITSFRLASTHRRFDRAQGRWADGETNWFTITTFRQLAINSAGSVSKGDRVIVSGRLRIRGWEVGDRSGTTVDVEADAVGHDLSWGTAAFTRTIVSAPARTESGSTDTNTDSGEANGGFPTAAALEAEGSQQEGSQQGESQTVDSDSIAVPF